MPIKKKMKINSSFFRYFSTSNPASINRPFDSLNFPLKWSLKVICHNKSNSLELENAINETIKNITGDEAKLLSLRETTTGRYKSLTYCLKVKSSDDLYSVYSQLALSKFVKMVL